MFDEVEALSLARQDQRDRDVTLAWLIVSLGAATWSKGRVPDLPGLLAGGRRERPQSLAEQRAALEIIAQRLGRQLRTKDDRTMRKAQAS